ncbi:Protein of unknown function [Noviherbaspirillum humi]|uniref:DUF3108 domain-containing protein n=1 Tax=Noviherbaspirillum humi TaxID=1688639 RepID=A0A239CHU8_9BURK|nr:DUF3108 domain-containing protein [Noviherbaspirillum humi]SNS19241.1 Protein of unknown function [Noviherbaspirillum humi]
MPTRLRRRLISAILLAACACLQAPLLAADVAPVRVRINPAPSAELKYLVKARQSGITLEGEATVRWSAGDGRYAVESDSRAQLLGKILEVRSEGGIDEFGLAPAEFNEKRFRKEATVTTFDRTAKVIRFGASSEQYPIRGGEQDRSSVVWQLIGIARATPDRFKPGSEWQAFVAGARDAEPWTFRVIDQPVIDSAMGKLKTVHIVREPPPDSRSQRLDIWLAPSQEWYPVKLRFSEVSDEYVEQTLQHVNRKQP